jgi:hypothetical protein
MPKAKTRFDIQIYLPGDGGSLCRWTSRNDVEQQLPDVSARLKEIAKLIDDHLEAQR